MIEVIGVRFRRAGKIYYFSPNGFEINVGDNVIVETARGVEYGNVVLASKKISEEEIVSPLKEVIRVATPEDDEIE
jgi:cell fate regulator YaaT (PSP1 superfamily)